MIAANKPTSVATAMGYLDTTRQVKKTRRYRRLPRSTPSLSPSPVSPSGDDFEDINDEGEPLRYCMKPVPISETAHVDLTGRFPVYPAKAMNTCW